MTDKELTPTEQKLREEIAQIIGAAGLYDSGVSSRELTNQIFAIVNQSFPELAKERGYKSPEQIREIVEGMNVISWERIRMVLHREDKTTDNMFRLEAIAEEQLQSCKEQMLKQVSAE